MAVDEILSEIEQNQRIVDKANRRIKELTQQLRESPFEGYDLVPVSEAARKINMSACWIYGLINSGKLKAVRKGRLMVSAAEVIALKDL